MQRTVRKMRGMRLHRNILNCAAILFAVFFGLQATATELTTAYQESYPKYYQSDPNDSQQVRGLCIDIIRAIEKTVPVTITAPGGFLPFKRLQNQLGTGQIDLFVGMAKNKARAQRYIFIDTPLYEVNHIIAARREDPAFISSFDDIRALAPDNIILTNLGTATEQLLKEQKGLVVDSDATSIEANLKKLLYGRGRFICFHDIGLIGAIQRYGYQSQVKTFAASCKQYYHYLALAPTTPKETVALIDKAVRELAASGELQRIRAQYLFSSDN